MTRASAPRSQLALPARAAERLLEIANGMDNPHGWVDVGRLNYTFLGEGASPDEYWAGIQKLKGDGLVEIHPSGTQLTLTEKGKERFAQGRRRPVRPHSDLDHQQSPLPKDAF